MDFGSNNQKLDQIEEIEEDDSENYFLQPASSPYNIADKIQQANIDLFNENNSPAEKTSRVKFKEDLYSFEPEPEELMTDDDVNSIESDPPEPTALNHSINLNIFDIIEDEEEIFEEILEECLEEEQTNSSCNVLDVIAENPPEQEENTVSRKKKRRKLHKSPGKSSVECRNHCIERLDFDLSMSIRKLDIKEKPVACPLLKLQSRKCCEENRMKNLPCYNGLRSEYGLSSAELERREKRRETLKVKEQKRRQLQDEHKNRKNRQNEEVFCQWLKDVARRKSREKIDRNKESLAPNVISFGCDEKPREKQQDERPNTANEFLKRNPIQRAKRPHTSCFFIQVPPKILQKGIHIGDLLVTNSKCPQKKMHILTVSA